MFQKVHLRLCALFSGITALVVIALSLICLFFANQSLENTTFLSFQNDITSFITNLENQNVISYEWLSKLKNTHKYLITLYDNGTELSFSSRTMTNTQRSLLNEARDYYLKHLADTNETHSLTSSHLEYKLRASDGKEYYASFAYVSKSPAPVETVVVRPITELTRQLRSQYLRFILLDILAIAVLGIFCWYFTKRLLAPIEASQKKQIRFVAAASHELRTPLAVILSSLSALKKANREEQEGFLRIIALESRRMSHLVNDMLTLANADSHSWSFHMRTCELDTLLLNSYEAFEPLAREKQLSLSVSLPDETLPGCFCDEDRIAQVLGILLTNAMHYGADQIHLLLSYAPQRGFYLTVADNGCGISDEDKPLVFERFYRADTSRSTKDHFGLGLSIAREIIDKHNGNIEILDTPKGGCTFRIFLPKVQP